MECQAFIQSHSRVIRFLGREGGGKCGAPFELWQFGEVTRSSYWQYCVRKAYARVGSTCGIKHNFTRQKVAAMDRTGTDTAVLLSAEYLQLSASVFRNLPAEEGDVLQEIAA